MVGHVIEIEHRLRRVSRAVYGVFGLCYESRSRLSRLGAGLRVVSVNPTPRTYLVEAGTTEAHHYMDYPQEAPGSGGFQSR